MSMESGNKNRKIRSTQPITMNTDVTQCHWKNCKVNVMHDNIFSTLGGSESKHVLGEDC